MAHSLPADKDRLLNGEARDFIVLDCKVIIKADRASVKSSRYFHGDDDFLDVVFDAEGLELLGPQRFTRGGKVLKSSLNDVMARRLKDDLRRLVGGFPERDSRNSFWSSG